MKLVFVVGLECATLAELQFKDEKMKKVFNLALCISLLIAGFFKCTTARKTSDLSASKEVVVLIHGFGRSNWALRKLASRLEMANYHTVRVGYGSFFQNINEIQKEVFEQIDECCAHLSTKVHFVGHSLGGLLIRSYLGDHEVMHLGNVVLLGSPNQGTEMVEYLKDRWWFSFLGPTALQLGSKESPFLQTLKPPYYNLGVIAGNKEREGFEHVLPGADDGLVRVESTKVKGMKDFLLLPVSHTRMRYDLRVADNTIFFLKNRRFRDVNSD